MNNIEIPLPIAYMILYPGAGVMRNAEGHIMVLANVDRPGYVEVQHFEQMERDGLITIHTKNTNDLARQYGRVNICYTVN